MTSRENLPAYIIIGAPRSGTSALTLIFKEQGIPMYLSADAPDIDSPSGNQEDNLVRLLNNFLMGENGLGYRRNWDNPKYINLNQTTSQHIHLIKKYVSSRERNAGERGWGVKDPRMSFLIEPWSLATQEHSVNWIYIRRENREASISSLIKMLPAKFFLLG